MSESELNVEWQPAALGLMVTFAGLDSEQRHEMDIESNYEGSQTRLMATYETTPFRHGNAFYRQLHLMPFAGVMQAYDKITVTDGTVELTAEHSSPGVIAGLDVLYPIHRFWLSLRGYVDYHEIKFKTFDFDQKSVQRGCLFGGAYAF